MKGWPPSSPRSASSFPDCSTAARPGPAYLLLAAARDADMIVAGSRGAGGFARLLMGSLSTQISHHARCPVVIVPAEDRG